MVCAHTFRCGQYISVHPYYLSLGTFVALSSAECVEHLFCSLDVPFVFAQALVIFRVNDSVFALSERYPAKGVAVTDTAEEKGQGNERPCRAIRNCDGKIELNNPLHPVMNNRGKF